MHRNVASVPGITVDKRGVCCGDRQRKQPSESVLDAGSPAANYFPWVPSVGSRPTGRWLRSRTAAPRSWRRVWTSCPRRRRGLGEHEWDVDGDPARRGRRSTLGGKAPCGWHTIGTGQPAFGPQSGSSQERACRLECGRHGGGDGAVPYLAPAEAGVHGERRSTHRIQMGIGTPDTQCRPRAQDPVPPATGGAPEEAVTSQAPLTGARIMAKTARVKANRLGGELAWKEWNAKFKQAVLDLGSAAQGASGPIPLRDHQDRVVDIAGLHG